MLTSATTAATTPGHERHPEDQQGAADEHAVDETGGGRGNQVLAHDPSRADRQGSGVVLMAEGVALVYPSADTSAVLDDEEQGEEQENDAGDHLARHS